MPPLDRTLLLSVLASLVLGGGVSAASIAVAQSEAPAQQAVVSSSPVEPTKPSGTGTSTGPAKSVGKGSSMSCAGAKGCALVFSAPGGKALKPYGVVVKLLKSDETQATISVSGKKQVLTSGKAVSAGGLKVGVVGTPGEGVTLAVFEG